MTEEKGCDPFEERLRKSMEAFMMYGIGYLPLTEEDMVDNPLFTFVNKETGKEVKIYNGNCMELVEE